MTAIISEILSPARARLRGAFFRPDTREASLLLAHVLGWTEAQVIARHDQSLDNDQISQFEFLVDRRLTGEPVAYILGIKEFYGRDFRVDSRVLIPRPETEHLVEVVKELALPAKPSILDLGTGSGCLACTVALELPGSRVVATDLSLGALSVSRLNSAQHDLPARLALVAGDLARSLDLSRFDLVVSNPPYVGRDEASSLSREILDFEPDSALFAGAAGDLIYRRLFVELVGMRPGSWLVLEIGAGQADLIRQLSDNSPFALTQVRSDYAGHPRIAVLQHLG